MTRDEKDTKAISVPDEIEKKKYEWEVDKVWTAECVAAILSFGLRTWRNEGDFWRRLVSKS